MELESKKYKIRMIIIIVVLAFSIVLGVGAEKQCKEYYDQANKIIEIIQSIPEEEYAERIQEEKIDSSQDEYATKEKALKTMESIRAFYERLFKYSELYAVAVLSIAVSGTIIGFMMYFVFTGWILHKIWPDMAKWLSILIWGILNVIFITIGIIGIAVGNYYLLYFYFLEIVFF